MPTLPQTLEYLHCNNNKLSYLPTLPQKLQQLRFWSNPICEILNNDNYSLYQFKQIIQTLNNFRNLYYCLQFKNHFRKWLWEKVREPNVKKIYNPNYLIENLGDEDDLDTFLDSWK